jgi:hypothetical protein
MKLICVNLDRQQMTVCAWCSSQEKRTQTAAALAAVEWTLSTGICRACFALVPLGFEPSEAIFSPNVVPIEIINSGPRVLLVAVVVVLLSKSGRENES